MQSIEEQLKIILKGVSLVVDENDLKEKLIKSQKENKPLKIKLGLDPSAPDIHLGHSVVLRKIKQMQDFGHIAIIIIGDFTGKIGDPSGKSKGRVALTDEQVKHNSKTYFEQIFKILDKEKTIVKYNSEWLSKLSFEDVLRLASTTTVARMMERDDFQNRFKNQVPIGIHEFFYPLMQAHDSVHLEADIELGGTDQTFNVLMGRTLQKHLNLEPQIAMFMPLLEGLDGVEKMSKSLGNYIGVYEPAHVMFKKVMEVPDNLIIKYFELVTDIHPDEIKKYQLAMQQGENPRNIKYILAETITALYHSQEELIEAKNYYDLAFSKKTIPNQIPELTIKESMTLNTFIPILVENNYVQSNSEFRRLLQQSGIQVNEEKVTDANITLKHEDIIKIGKKKFVKIIIK